MDETIYAPEKLSNWFDEAFDLFKSHYAEVEHYQDIPLDIDRELYVAQQEAGKLRTYTVRINGRLVGYAIFVLSLNIRHRTSLQAVQDIIFVEQKHRGHVGYRFLKFIDQQLQLEGVEVVYRQVKADPDLNHGRVLERMGYGLIEHVYGKRLN